MKRIKNLKEIRKPRLANRRVRDELVKNSMFLWELAKLIDVSEATITRMMREELPDARQDELIDLIRKGAKCDDN